MNSRNQIRRVLSASLLAAACAGVVLPASELAAQQRRRPMTHAQMEAAAKRYKPGQWVEVEHFSKWEPAEVVSVDGVFIRVKLLAPEHEEHETSAFPHGVRGMTAERAAQFKKAQKAAADARAAAGAAEEAEAKRVAEIAAGGEADDAADPAPPPSAMSPVQLIEAAKKFPVGTKVDVYAFGAWRAGKVEKNADGQITVATEADGSQAVVTADKVRPASGKKPAAPGTAKTAKALAEAAAATGLAPVVDANFGVLSPAKPAANAPWAYPVPPAAPAKRSAADGKSLTLLSPFPGASKGSNAAFHRINELLVPTGGDGSVVGVQWAEGIGLTAQRRAQIVDVVAAKVLANLPMPADTLLRDVSPDGKRVLLRGTSWNERENTNVVHVYDVTDGGKSIKPLVAFKPYPDDKNTSWGKDVTYLRFLDKDHVLTCGAAGKLVLWALAGGATPKAVYAVDLGEDGGWTIPAPVLNAQRTAIAAPVLEGPVHLLDAKTGKSLGHLDGLTLKRHAKVEICFDDAGRRLAAAGGNGLLIWDLAKGGKPAQDLSLQAGVAAGDSMRFVGDSFLLLGGKDLLDLSKGIAVWEYALGEPATTEFLTGGGVVTAGDAAHGNPVGKYAKQVTAVAVPHAAALERAAAIKPGAFLAMQPGMTASIEVDVASAGGPPDIQQRAVKRVTEQLQANGITVAQQPQPLKVLITSKPGEVKQQKYGQGIGPFAKETGSASVQEVRHAVTITVDGKTAWSTGSGAGLPSTVWLKEGQSIQQVVDENRAGSFKFFDTVTLPARVLKPKDLLPVGKSKLGPAGLTDEPLPPLPAAAPVAAAPAKPAGASGGGDGLD